MSRQGFPDAAERIQELYLAGRKERGGRGRPDELVDLRALVAPPERIRSRYRAWEQSGATGLIVQANQEEPVDLIAEVAGLDRPCGS